MDQETARTLLEEGAVLLLLDVPPGTEFGIDYASWNTGERFRGVKMIPPGVHFVHYSAVDRAHGGRAPRTGFFHCFRAREVVTRRWDARTEEVLDSDGEGGEDPRGRLRELDPFLGPYPYENLKKWVSLTDRVDEALVEAVSPTCGRVSSAARLVPDGETRTTADRARLAAASEGAGPERGMPRMRVEPGTELRFSPIPARRYPEGAAPAEITRCGLDGTYALSSLLEGRYVSDPLRLLGEVQLAFVCFLVGQVYDAFEQWKRLVALLCSCEEAIARYEGLYSAFVQTLHFQLKEVPSDFFVDIVARQNFLTTALGRFFENLRSSGASDALKERGEKFRRNVTKKFRWDFAAQPEDEAPVVVDV